MKNVLVIYYSQSGQLKNIAENIAKPLLQDTEIQVTFYEIRLEKPFPFPWDNTAFFDTFPNSFLQIETPIQPIETEITNTKFDLILLHYQVWYLSPSIPINSFLKSPYAKKILANTPVITINGSRNMWIMAQEKVKFLLNQNKALLVGNIALVDRAPNLISVITIVEWMFTGIKKKYLGIFPLPGVSDKDIKESSKFGEIIKKHLLQSDFKLLQTELIQNNAVFVSSYLASVDRTGNKIFKKWANFIHLKKNNRKQWLTIFKIYLLLAIWIISPIVYILHVLLQPFQSKKRKEEEKYYQGV
jgi:hypothetical protein